MSNSKGKVRFLLGTGDTFTLQQIADLVGVSRERVRQLCNALELEGYYRKGPQSPRARCYICNQPAPRPYPKNKRFCCATCRHKKRYVTINCDSCGKTFKRDGNQYRRRLKNPHFKTKKQYCSRQCYGAWLGKNHGFGTRPENIRKGLDTYLTTESLE